jgi:hypothetical protein
MSPPEQKKRCDCNDCEHSDSNADTCFCACGEPGDDKLASDVDGDSLGSVDTRELGADSVVGEEVEATGFQCNMSLDCQATLIGGV